MKINTNMETQFGKVNITVEMNCEEMIKSVELTKDFIGFLQQNPTILGAIAGLAGAVDTPIQPAEEGVANGTV